MNSKWTNARFHPKYSGRRHAAAGCLAPEHGAFPASQAGHPKSFAGDSHWDLPPRDGRNRRSIKVREKRRTIRRCPRILVVEDDLGVRVLLKTVLAYFGFMVYWAADGFQAVKLYQELCPDIDIVLLEVQLPGLDGPQILDALQELNPEVCCCFMTAGSENYTEEDLLRRGAHHVLRKPFHLIQVARLLRHLVDRAEGVPPARTAPADGAANPPYTARRAGAPATCPRYQAIEDGGPPELYLG